MDFRAYEEYYVSKAQSRLGDAFDYAVNTCQIPDPDFAKQFAVSPTSKRMENGEPAVLVGKSGVELAIDVILETTGELLEIDPREQYTRSREYWIGWAVAYYQWYSSRSYMDIFSALPYEDLEAMYYPLHEAEKFKFVEIAEKRMHEHFSETNLKRFRTTIGCTQAELAKRSGVSLRSIQMYEQRNKDINKASAESLYRISKNLGCTMENLLEK